MNSTKSPALAFAALGVLAAAAKADDANFKAYGFADVELVKYSYHSNNFLVQQGIVQPNTHAYLDHLNTYLDWNPNPNIRVLSEIAFNPDPTRTTTPGTTLRADSAAIYNSINSQIGAATQAGFVQYLRSTPYAAYGTAALNHIADSLTRDTLSKATHAVAQKIRAYPSSASSTSSRDNGISIPRIHIDLLLADEINVRVGKFLTPSGIWNVDHGSPTIITIKQPYETSFYPFFPEFQTGAQLFGHTGVGDHDLSYATWITTGRGGATVKGSSDFGQDPQNLDDWAVGAHLQTDLAFLNGIRVGGTFHTGTLRETSLMATIPVTAVDVSTQATTIDLAGQELTQTTDTYMRELCFGLDTKVQWKGLLLQGEWNHRQLRNLLADEARTNFNAGYVLLGYRHPINASFDVMPYAMWEIFSWDKDEVRNNPALGLTSLPTKGFSDYLAGLNFGIYGNVRLKLEYSYVVQEANPMSSGTGANTYTDDDLVAKQYAAQLSVAF